MSLDSISESSEYNEIYPDIPEESGSSSQPDFEPSPDIPVEQDLTLEDLEKHSPDFLKAVNEVETVEGAEALIENEYGKAASVLDLATGSYEAAVEAAGDESLFLDEKTELAAITQQLATVDTLSFQELDIVEAKYLETVDLGTEKITDLQNAATDLERASPVDESKLGHQLTLGPEIIVEGLTPEQSEAGKRALFLMDAKHQAAKNIEEIKLLKENIDQIRQRSFEDDDQYDNAQDEYSEIKRSIDANTPIEIPDGMTDMETGAVSSITVLEGDELTGTGKRYTPEQLREAEKRMQNTTRGQLNGLYEFLDDYEAVAQGKRVEGSDSYNHELRTRLNFTEPVRDSWQERIDARRKSNSKIENSDQQESPTPKTRPKDRWK